MRGIDPRAINRAGQLVHTRPLRNSSLTLSNIASTKSGQRFHPFRNRCGDTRDDRLKTKGKNRLTFVGMKMEEEKKKREKEKEDYHPVQSVETSHETHELRGMTVSPLET